MLSQSFDKRAAGRSLLIVDDDMDAREVLTTMLSAHGFRVAGCSNGREALTWLGSAVLPDVILLDLRMPEMNGWEFRVAQKKEPAYATIPVIALTGDATPQALAIDAEAYVQKPVDHSTLLGALDRLILMIEHGELQARLAHTDRLTSLGTLAAGVAHELNNPLAYMLMNLDYVAAQLAKSRDAEKSELLVALDHVRHGAERIRNIVGGLKMFSRPGGEMVTAFDVTQVLDATMSMVAHELGQRGRLIREYSPTPRVLANEAKLGQVFLNLILNAVQALPEDRSGANQIRLVVRCGKPDRVVVEVHDNGVGIDPQVQGRIFEPFFTTKPVGIGTGLGLAICHGIVTSLGGGIAVASELGRGTVFSVDLPAAGDAKEQVQGGSAKERAVATRSAPKEQGSILIIDDEAIVGTSLKRLLAKEGHVLAVTTAREGLAYVESGMRFDVILCDVLMPDMDGPAFYNALHEAYPQMAERIIFTTGGAFTARAREFLERVPNQRLSKPFDIDALIALVRSSIV